MSKKLKTLSRIEPAADAVGAQAAPAGTPTAAAQPEAASPPSTEASVATAPHPVLTEGDNQTVGETLAHQPSVEGVTDAVSAPSEAEKKRFMKPITKPKFQFFWER